MLFNIIWFYLGWWGIALLAKRDSDLFLLALTITFILIHLLVHKSKFKAEIRTVLLVATVGVFGDLVLNYFGVFNLQKSYVLWLPSIWLLFAGTLRHSLKNFLELNSVIVFSLGAIGGPASYYLASRLELINYPLIFSRLTIHFVYWGLLTFILKLIMRKIDETN